jgi:hypothetical protein
VLTEPQSEDVRDRLKQCTHDLNNVLGQILGFGSLLVRDLADANTAGKVEAGVVEYAQELLAAGMRGEVIARQLAGIVRALPAMPMTGAVPSPPTVPQPAPVPTGSKRRLLIAGIADGAEDARAAAFAERGWQVETHRSGADALRRFRASTTPFDAVIAHPATEEIRGAELVAAIKALKPATVCVLLFGEGIADEAAARLAGADGGLPSSVPGVTAVAMVDDILSQR